MVVEELLTGPEISVLAISDGYSIVTLPTAQDHKRVGEGDTGLNTGGMGAYAPAPIATKDVLDRIMRETLRPTIDGMRKEGIYVRKLVETCIANIFSPTRLSILRNAFHWFHVDTIWSQGFGI